jgi:hypothetical protein
MTKEQDFITTFDNLVMSKNNVRADDESPVDTLAASLLNHGQISALVVEPDGKKYGVVAGGRRYRAFRDLLKRKLMQEEFSLESVNPQMARSAYLPTLSSHVGWKGFFLTRRHIFTSKPNGTAASQ